MSNFKFSEMQNKAVNHTTGPALVIAGPGSGKTTVIISRILKLLETRPGVRVLSLTFSRAAAKEMESRFSSLVASASLSPFQKASALSGAEFSTIHALAYSVLKSSDSFRNSKVIDENTKVTCIIRLCREINNEELPRSDCETLVSFISRIKGNPSQKDRLIRNVQVKNFEKIYENYEKYKQKNNLTDFEDMVTEAIRILSRDNRIRGKYVGAYDFIQADEAQDLTSEQFCFVRLLSPEGNIFVVGDDDQAIYGFRGANPGSMKAFSEEMPSCRIYSLSENHRCGRSIVSLSSEIIAVNPGRFDKKLVSAVEISGRINLLHVRDSYALGKFLVSDLHSGTTGILYRNNRSAFAVMAALIHFGIPFVVNDAVSCETHEYFELFFRECLKENLSPVKYIRRNGIRHIRMIFTDSVPIRGKNTDNVDLAVDLILLLSKYHSSLSEFQNAAACLFRTAENACFLQNRKPAVFLSTIHSSKGLEYDNVYLIDVNKDEFPGKSSAEGRLLCEERRLFYVGITRGKSRLNIIYSEKRFGKRAEESIFFREALKARIGIPKSPHRGKAALLPGLLKVFL